MLGDKRQYIELTRVNYLGQNRDFVIPHRAAG